jgi:two-component system chemotaxis response regulator CheY
LGDILGKKKNLSILIVEDNGMFLTIAQEMLPEHDVITAGSAKDGLALYKKHNPDIVFLDITLPDGNGHDVLGEIKKINKDAYVIMLTASRLKDDVIKSMDEGAEGYVMKPFSDGMIHQCIEEFLKK